MAAIPKPVGLYPFTKFYKADDVSGNAENGVLKNVELGTGPDGRTADRRILCCQFF